MTPSKSIATTEALSVSKVLPDGCLAFRNGLKLTKGLSHEAWLGIGSQLTQLAGASMWLIGDWLAYGQTHYHGLEGFERIETNRYEKISEETGYAPGTLRNAKCVCSAVNLSRRRDKLTFGHAQEIVGRVAPAQYDFWIRKTVDDGLSIKKLREEIRRSTAKYQAEPNDVGVTTDIEWLRQVERDFLHKARSWGDPMKQEARTLLRAMAEALG